MNPIDLLMQDHRKVEKLFSEFLASEAADGRQEDLFQEIQTELLVHAEVEEQAFYPALKNEVPDQVEQAIEDHLAVKQILAELLDADFEDEIFETRFMQLMEDVQNHVKEEEGPGGIMEIARERLDSEALANLGREIQRIKQNVQRDLAA